MTVSFKTTRQEMDLIFAIVDRAVKLWFKFSYEPIGLDRLQLIMDLSACHASGRPLDLTALLEASDGDFGHDVFGIQRHINRDTGQLEDGFSPRYSAG